MLAAKRFPKSRSSGALFVAATVALFVAFMARSEPATAHFDSGEWSHESSACNYATTRLDPVSLIFYDWGYADRSANSINYHTVLLATVTALVAVSVKASTGGQTPASLAYFRTDFSDYTPQTIHGFADFPLYSLGTEFENLPLTYITRVLAKPQLSAVGGAAHNLPANQTNYVNFIYGTCSSRAGEGGCAPPLTVQVWPACDRTLQDYYYNTPDGGPSRDYVQTTIRSVPAARFSDMLEIYSGRVTIVIFGDTATLRADAAEKLASANSLAGAISPGDSLPSPVAGAMEGRLDC